MLMRAYHQCLEVLLAPVTAMQQQPPLLYHRRGDYVKELLTFLKVAIVSADGKAADVLSAKVQDKGPKTPRLSRRCLT